MYTEVFKHDVADFTYADLKSNFKFRGCLRSIWPQNSQSSSFSLKYHIVNAFFNQIFQPGHEDIDMILFNKQKFWYSGLWPLNTFEAS